MSHLEDDVADDAGLLCLCPPLLAEGVFARGAEGDELRQPERGRAADAEKSGRHVLHQPSYLSALFKQETGSTLIDYINTQRVNRAAQLLVQNNHTIAAVAEEVGILDVNYFTKIFKKTLGVTPTRYRREHKEK